MRTSLPILLYVLLSGAQGCASVDVAKPSFSRVDDAHALRLQNLRLWTNGGYPLWLEVHVPRTGGEADDVVLVFTTNISTHPRFGSCKSVELSNGREDYSSARVQYSQTPMELEAELGSGGGNFRQHGVVEDVRVTIPNAAFEQLVERADIAGNICQVPIRFETWHVEQMRRMLHDRRARGEPTPLAAR